MDLDLTKPIRMKSSATCLVSYAGVHLGAHIFVIDSQDRPLVWAMCLVAQNVDEYFENIPEHPWYPDDSGHWIEGGIAMLPKNVATFEVLTKDEREKKTHFHHEYRRSGLFGGIDIVAVKPVTVRYVK